MATISNLVNAVTRDTVGVEAAIATYLNTNSVTSILVTYKNEVWKIDVNSATSLTIYKPAPETGANRDSYLEVTSEAELTKFYDFLASDTDGSTSDFSTFYTSELVTVVGTETFSFDTSTVGAEVADVIRVSGQVLDHFGANATGKGPFTVICVLQNNADGSALVAGVFDAATATTGTVDIQQGNLIMMTTDDNGAFDFDLTDTGGASGVTVMMSFVFNGHTNTGSIEVATATYD